MIKREDLLEVVFFTITIIVVTIFISIMLFNIEITSYIRIINTISSMIVIIILSVVIYVYFSNIYLKPYDYSVAIVGYPLSGKTTLIVSIFIEAFERKIKMIRKFAPRGDQTIERINKYIQLLKDGKVVGPTTDQDIFSYKAKIIIHKGLFDRSYNLRIGDFPGNNSRSFCEHYGEWWHTTSYYKWVQESDTIIYVIDLAPYLITYDNKQKYINNMTQVARAAWNSYIDVNEFRNKNIINNPVILLFTKSDLLGLMNLNELIIKEGNLEKNNIFKEKGYGNDSPEPFEINNDLFEINKKIVLNDFSEIIDYFNLECKNFKPVFISSYGLINTKRIGVEELFENLIE